MLNYKMIVNLCCFFDCLQEKNVPVAADTTTHFAAALPKYNNALFPGVVMYASYFFPFPSPECFVLRHHDA